ncbi:MAG: pentapeptide repeat-containing protein, partial [Bacteroidetes bacterium]|nr:pentapeptide repeat-containing protein [Bacteroidota bacterium]
DKDKQEDVERRDQIIQLTKQVLAASLTMDEDAKVRKTATIALVHHHPWKDEDKKKYADARGLDLSGAQAQDAYWARVDFNYADFYDADLSKASLREAILHGAQFRETDLRDAVLVKAKCDQANFKLADLRGADLSGANLVGARFDGAKVYGATLAGATHGENPDAEVAEVDVSEGGDGSEMIPVHQWLVQQGSSETAT